MRRPDGSTDLLDVHDGVIARVAASAEAFDAAVIMHDWQERYLYSALVMRYRRERGRGARPGRGRMKRGRVSLL